MNSVLNFAQESPIPKHLDALVQDLCSHCAVVKLPLKNLCEMVALLVNGRLYFSQLPNILTQTEILSVKIVGVGKLSLI